MSKIDYLAIDGHTLTTFLTVLEEGSVSKAADRLGVTQSAVSHTLVKLRKVFDNPLFVRVGRGIEPTARANELRAPIESVLDGIRSLAHYHQDFDPLEEEMEFTVAANDFPVQLIFPRLLRELSSEGVHLKIRFIPSGIPKASALRASRYRMLITPTPPNDRDLEWVSLVKAKMAVFYDSAIRAPPGTWQEYAASSRVEVKFSDTEASMMALPALDPSLLSSPVIAVANFGSLAPMILGTDRITTQLDVMKRGLLGELEVAPLPIATDPLDLLLMWHRREHDDPAHRWFRERIIETMNSILSD